MITLFRTLFVILLLLALVGCSVRTVTVQVPVPVPCTIPELPAPTLPVDSLKPDESNVFVIDRALWASIELLEGYVGQLQEAIKGCNAP